MAPRVMVVLPTHTYRAGPFLDACGRNGIEVVVAANEASSLGAFMEGRYLTLDLGRPGESAGRAEAFVAGRPVDAVLGVDEASVVTAAHIAARLRLPHNPVAAVEATRDKRRLRELLAAAGVPQPAFVELPGGDLPEAIRRVEERIGFPCVVKPVDRAASQGVIRADDRAGLEATVARVSRLLATDEQCAKGPPPLLAERFIAGFEVAVEGMVTDGRLDVVAIFDKPDPLDGPFFEETLYVTPTRLAPAVAARVAAVTGAAVVALGLTRGPIHAELRLSDQGPTVVEVAARSIGGLCSRSVRFASGRTIEDVIVRQAAGLGTGDLSPAPGATGVLMLPIPRAGRLLGIEGVDEARGLAGITEISITIPTGTALVPLPEGDRYLGFVFAQGESAGSVERVLRAALGRLRIDMSG